MKEKGCMFYTLLLIIDFLFISFGFWVITLVLNALGIAITFTWSLAFGVWVILKMLKLIF